MTILVKTRLLNLPDISDETKRRIMEQRLEKVRARYFSIIVDGDDHGENIEQDLDLNADLIHILKDYAAFPYEPVSVKARKLGYSIPSMTRHLDKLQELKYVEEHKVNMGKGSGVVRLYKFLDQGTKLAGNQSLVGRGSMQHGFWMYTIRKCLEHEYRVELEYYCEDVKGSIDVAVFDGEKRVLACQVELNNNHKHSCQNIEKCQRAKFSRVVVASPSEYLLKGIKNQALNQGISLENVEFKLLKEFYDEYYRGEKQT